MSRKASEDVEYTLRSLSSLMGERRRRQPEPGAPGGERSLLATESATSLQSAELERAARRQFQRDETPAFVYAAAAFSALGGFLFGYDTGVVSGAMLLLRRQMRLGAMWQELLVSGAVGAAAVAALAGGALNGALGRRSAILLASALCTAGSAVLAAAANKETLLAGRLVVGLGIGEWPRPRAPLTPPPVLPYFAALWGLGVTSALVAVEDALPSFRCPRGICNCPRVSERPVASSNSRKPSFPLIWPD